MEVEKETLLGLGQIDRRYISLKKIKKELTPKQVKILLEKGFFEKNGVAFNLTPKK